MEKIKFTCGKQKHKIMDGIIMIYLRVFVLQATVKVLLKTGSFSDAIHKSVVQPRHIAEHYKPTSG